MPLTFGKHKVADIQVCRVASGGTSTVKPEIVVPLVDARCRVTISFYFRRDNGSQSSRPPSDCKAWVCARTRDAQGVPVPVGSGSTRDILGLGPASLEEFIGAGVAGRQGWGYEEQSGADEVYALFDVVTNASGSGQTGTWILSCSIQPTVPLCSDEWEDIKRAFVPMVLSGQGSVIGN